jgi:hypothetical protein
MSLTMSSPYRGFAQLNHRRGALIVKRHSIGLDKREARELAMLTACVEAMVWYSTKQGIENHPGIEGAVKELRTTGKLEVT